VLSMLLSLGDHISVNVPPCQILQIVLRTIGTVGQNLLGLLPRLLLDRFYDRLKLFFVVGLLRDACEGSLPPLPGNCSPAQTHRSPS
jgi:hypothetical protein